MLWRVLKAFTCFYVATALFGAPGFSQPTTGQTPALKPEVPQSSSRQKPQASQQPLTLGVAISSAQKNKPSLRASAARIAVEQGNISLAKTAYQPRSDFFWQTHWASGQEEVLLGGKCLL